MYHTYLIINSDATRSTKLRNYSHVNTQFEFLGFYSTAKNEITIDVKLGLAKAFLALGDNENDRTAINKYKNLERIEQALPKKFVSKSQNYMLNTQHVAQLNCSKPHCSLKEQNLQLPFSRTYKENIDTLNSKLSKSSISSHT